MPRLNFFGSEGSDPAGNILREQGDTHPTSHTDKTSRPSSLLHFLAQDAAIGAGYLLLAALVRTYFHQYRMWPAPIWLPSGLALFVSITIGIRCAPGLFLGSLATSLIEFGDTLASSIVISVGNTLAPLMAGGLARNYIRDQFSFESVRQVVTFCTASLLLGTCSALIAIPSMLTKESVLKRGMSVSWADWLLSDAGAALLLTPLFLILKRIPDAFRQLSRQTEFVLTLMVAGLTVLHLVRGTEGPQDAGSAFLVLLPLLWLAVRFSIYIAYPIFGMVMTALIAATMNRMGPFWVPQTGGPLFVFAEMSVGFGVAILLLGAAASEQRAAEFALRELNTELEKRVQERTTELQQSQAELERAALQDPLTGLPNRRALESHFAICQAAARRKNRPFTVLLIDLDFFKQINDSFGHDAGDTVLVETAHRLRGAVRQCDVVARMGGDEFMVLLPDTTDHADIESVCQRITTVLSVRLEIGGQTFTIAASLGIAMFPNDGANWQNTYKAADTALYHAKRSGRGQWKWHDSTLASAVESCT